ncbi:adenosine deaminase 2-like [Topomyia yanbarensis]|uniref:adenosine deaminase 2-like n=1 Tax=Topomyia yanbarensis TaxID=2498891 RepID=UPI00273BA431|nr:adenosine deaminase 2-like [Topomyia yanbarensis]XP_058831689.1 adenosine deaminase 2-like [Topomyia yanbarensis]XP_058831690.1 adenosine deaminase 2-like [Topomyia yanbarensis]XP_058831691.1 adenosine deaminase 2-like [Topomyia yanbarensis]
MKLLLILMQIVSLVRINRANTLMSAVLDDNLGMDDMINRRPSFEEYEHNRKQFIEEEEGRFLGADLNLSTEEQIVNEYAMKLKRAELEQGFNDSYKFIPARHFFEVLERFNESKLFQLIQKLPKGAVLHAHDTAIGSTELIVNATYSENLWQRGDFEGDTTGLLFEFSKEAPCGDGWKLVSDVRSAMSAEVYDEKIRKMFGLYTENPISTYKSINDVWGKFQEIFNLLYPIINYEPVWRQYFYDCLEQLYDDNVQYLEIRGVLPPVYDLSGKIYSPEEIIQIYINETERFKQSHPQFIGVKIIYAPVRFANDTTFDGYLETVRDLHQKFPNFLAGFDLVGQEDTGRPLIDFVPQLLTLPDSIRFFFHAGETNWYGMRTDRNLIDAILLGTQRIGHGFALLKHPNLMKIVKRRQICVEINPISNQVLKLVDDYRNHPAVVFFSDNYPVVVSSDDPSFWRASPLSHDFYMAFVGIASAHHDLRLLKRLAMNSLEFSAMNQTEKDAAKRLWKSSWHNTIKELAKEIASFETA